MFTALMTYVIGSVAVAAAVVLPARAASKRCRPVAAQKSNCVGVARSTLVIAAGLALTLNLSACGEPTTGKAESAEEETEPAQPAEETETAEAEKAAKTEDGGAAPVQVTGKEHFQKVTDEGRVLVDFYADWCGPCKAMAPILKDMAKEYSDTLTVAKVNVDKHRDLAKQHGVRGIPHLVLYQNGKAVDSSTGYRDKKALTKWLAESAEK